MLESDHPTHESPQAIWPANSFTLSTSLLLSSLPWSSPFIGRGIPI
ncbi:MAG: hypothetical protein ABSG92_04800 [Conexivisphaerales archaeon]